LFQIKFSFRGSLSSKKTSRTSVRVHNGSDILPSASFSGSPNRGHQSPQAFKDCSANGQADLPGRLSWRE